MKLKTGSLAVLFTGVILSANAFATAPGGDCASDPYFCISSVSVESLDEPSFRTKSLSEAGTRTEASEEGEEEEVLSTNEQLDEFSEGADKVLKITKTLVAIGEEVYKVVNKGRPNLTVNSTPVSVLPRGTDGLVATDLTEWNEPVVKKYRYVIKNYYNIEVISFEYAVIATAGGKHNGKGKYLTGVEVKPLNVNVAWGFDFDAEMKLQSISNIGTAEEPVAAMVISIDHKLNTILSAQKSSTMYYVTGAGRIKTL